jgi:preprotein translocase subunit SecG
LLVLLVLVQREEGAGMAGMMGGAGSQAFGAKSGNILTRTTGILVGLFFVCAFSLALLNKAPNVADLESVIEAQQEEETSGEWWKEEPSLDGEEADYEVAGPSVSNDDVFNAGGTVITDSAESETSKAVETTENVE